MEQGGEVGGAYLCVSNWGKLAPHSLPRPSSLPPIQDINLPLQSHILLRVTFHVSLPILGLAVTATFSLCSFR